MVTPDPDQGMPAAVFAGKIEDSGHIIFSFNVGEDISIQHHEIGEIAGSFHLPHQGVNQGDIFVEIVQYGKSDLGIPWFGELQLK
jgi:hypothetical protein